MLATTDRRTVPRRAPVTRERAERLARLRRIERARAAGASGPALEFERAQLLDVLGMTAAAREAYLAIVARDTGHAGALNELGRLLDRTGYPTAARTAYARAVAVAPSDPIGHGNLATSLLDAGEVDAARRHYEISLELDPTNVSAHACLAVLLLRLGDETGAAEHARIGFAQVATAWPYRGERAPIPVVVIRSALGGNVALERYLDDETFAKWTIVAEFCDPARPLPPHALIVNAVGDADRCTSALQAAHNLLARATAPIVNSPSAIVATGRQANAQRLATLTDVIAPRVVTFARADLLGPDGEALLGEAAFHWPLIVRAPGFHTGKHCTLVRDPAEFVAAVRALPSDEVLVIAYVDTRASDGTYRKYRAMVVDGQLYPLHLAIGHHWMVHYFTADMAAHADYRAADAAFLADMAGTLGARAMAALDAVARCLQLEYGGIDFALDADGRVVVFEANATMIVLPPPPEALWSYRRVAVERIDAAVRKLLLVRASASAK